MASRLASAATEVAQPSSERELGAATADQPPHLGASPAQAQQAAASTAPTSNVETAARPSGAGMSVQEGLSAIGATALFEKVLTASDTAGRIIIPKDAAAEYLPQLEFASGMSVPFIDTLGNSYHFRFRFWQNTSRIFLLEGTQEMQGKYGLQAGDSVVFAKQADGTLVVCGMHARGDRVALPQLPKAPRQKPGSGKSGLIAKETPQKKRARASQPASGSGRPSRPQRMDQLQDGVFRAVPGLTAEKAAVTHMNGTWTATLDLAGEVYRAYFDSQEAALEAYHAAGAVT